MAATRKTRKPARKSASRPAGKASAAGAEGAKASPAEKPHRFEWIIGAVALVLVVFLLGYLGFRGFTDDQRPPELAARVKAVEEVADRFHVTVSVTNSGSRTAAAVIVEARFGGAGDEGESIEIELDYVPSGSTREATFISDNDPATNGGVELSVLGYRTP